VSVPSSVPVDPVDLEALLARLVCLLDRHLEVRWHLEGRGSGGGQEGVRRGSKGGQKGVRRAGGRITAPCKQGLGLRVKG
jgi:hypothetical protein